MQAHLSPPLLSQSWSGSQIHDAADHRPPHHQDPNLQFVAAHRQSQAHQRRLGLDLWSAHLE